MIRGKKMNLAFGSEEIYEDAEFYLGDLDKVGIAGVNGAGKTTLFRILLKKLELDTGVISIGNSRIGYLPQEIVIDDEDMTVLEFLSEGRPIKRIESELNDVYIKLIDAQGQQQDDLLKKMGALQEQLDYFDWYESESILLDLIDSMRIDLDLLDEPISKLSGGQKSKIAFAKVLYSKPEILLLDEPTNHIDSSTKEFITKYLKNYKGMILVISHEIEFLNQIVGKILYIDKVTHKIVIYEGDYDTFKKKYAESKKLKEKVITQQEKEVKELTSFVQRAKQASRTNHALKRMGLERELRLEKKKKEMETRDGVYKRVKMDIKPFRNIGTEALKVENMSFHYPGHPNIYNNLSFKIKGKERFLIVGKNGVGKSTLLKLLVGINKPDTGRIQFDSKTDVAYYSQELDQLNEKKTILENVSDNGYADWKLRSVLSNFLFYDNDVNKKVAVLSPGEKARIVLCKILLKKANLLILDEPTNHLDPDTQAIIGKNFNLFEGTIIVVSHNSAFVEQIGINRMLVLPKGRIDDYSPELLESYYA